MEGSSVTLSVVLRAVFCTLPFLSTLALAREGRCYYGNRDRSHTCEGPSSYTCEGFFNDEDLSDAAVPTEGDIKCVFVHDVHLNYLRSDTFQNSKFRNVEHLEVADSTLAQITDSDVALRGLEDSLERLFFESCAFLHSLDWNSFRNLRKLYDIHIRSCSMSDVEGVQELSSASLREVWITKSGLTYLPEGAFAGLPKLVRLGLYDNEISELTRSMLPNPTAELQFIDLRRNKLKNLPSDIFTNMPALTYIELGYNELMVLDEKTLEPVWHRLVFFYAYRNPLSCDCRLSWMLNSKFPEDFRAECRYPEKLKGKELKSLSMKDLYCF